MTRARYLARVAGKAHSAQLPTVTAYTTNQTFTSAHNGQLSTNQGASGEVQITLPSAALDLEFRYAVVTAQYFRMIATGGATISLGDGLTSAANGFVRSNTVGSMLHLVAVSTTRKAGRGL